MRDETWKTLVLSDINYEHLVAEISYGDQFLLLLDREQGRDSLCIAFPKQDGQLGARIPISEFIEKLHASANDLCQ
jgi:hypothetical protein